MHGVKKRVLCRGIVVFLLICFFHSESLAQKATLKGLIKDSETGEVLPAANIIVQRSGDSFRTGRSSDLNGTFEIQNLDPGTYTVTVSYIGYVKYINTEVQLEPGETKVLEIALVPTAVKVNPISVTASKRPEKLLEAPASISIVDAEQIEVRASLTTVDHMKTLPGIDLAQSGLVQANMVARGFNGVFSGALLVLTDNRIARVPSLRLNAYSLLPVTNDDIERIEVVLGPGSALYGPNSANGVMHILTKSPFDARGTVVSIGGGGRDFLNISNRAPGGGRNIYLASFRHASVLSPKVGFKISGQYYQGHDWEYYDPAEPPKILKGKQTAQGRIAVGDSVPNQRDFNVKKIALDARLDINFNDDTRLIFNGAIQQIDQIELTGIGAAQGKNWRYSYFQTRFNYKNLFIQGFINMSDAGQTYLLRSGDLIVDNSKLIVGQIQHSVVFGNRQRFTYGADVLLTRPDTKGTINGRNENDDNMDEVGAYLQSETTLSPKLDLVLAARIDKHNRLPKSVFSPRAALVFKPKVGHNFRLTYNRAFSTPDNNNLFLDILSAPDAFGLGALLEPVLGFRPATDVRAQGVPSSGFRFRYDANNLPMFRSPFAPLAGLNESDFISLNDPNFINVMWSVARTLIFQGMKEQFRQPLRDQGFSDAFIDQLFADFEQSILPQAVSGVKNILAKLNPQTAGFDPVVDLNREIKDVKPLIPSTTETYEFGYKGVIADKLMLNFDLYHTRVRDRVGPLAIETPNVFLDQNTLQQYLYQEFSNALSASKNFLLVGILSQLDLPENGGNGNGTPADELSALFASNAAKIPFGTVTFEEARAPTAVILTYRNFGDVSYTGIDFGFNYFINNNWSIGGSYSWVSKNFLRKEEEDIPFDVSLNGPKHKIGLNIRYTNPESGYDIQLRGRYVDGFPVIAGVYVGHIQTYTIFDLNLAYNLNQNTRAILTVNNIFDKRHREMIGAPELGRLIILQIKRQF